MVVWSQWLKTQFGFTASSACQKSDSSLPGTSFSLYDSIRHDSAFGHFVCSLWMCSHTQHVNDFHHFEQLKWFWCCCLSAVTCLWSHSQCPIVVNVHISLITNQGHVLKSSFFHATVGEVPATLNSTADTHVFASFYFSCEILLFDIKLRIASVSASDLLSSILQCLYHLSVFLLSYTLHSFMGLSTRSELISSHNIVMYLVFDPTRDTQCLYVFTNTVAVNLRLKRGAGHQHWSTIFRKILNVLNQLKQML